MLPERLAAAPRAREIELLAACARVEPSAADAARLAGALRGDLDWGYLVRAASAHGVLPLLLRHVAASDRVPAAVRAELRELRGASAQRGLLLTAALVEALRALAGARIEAVPFKGPLLAASLYGDIGLRPFRDVDVLLRPDDLGAAVAVLGRSGFVVAPGQAALGARLRSVWVSDLTLTRDATVLELHWRLTPAYFGVADTLDDITGSLVPGEVGGLPVRTLSATELLFYLCVHGATHRWERLEWICDVAEMLRRGGPVDWDRLLRRAERAGATRMVGLGLRLAGDLLGAPLPASAPAALAASRSAQALAARVYATLPDETHDPNPGLALAPFHLAMRERLRDRARYAAAVLLAPSPLDLESVRLPPALYPLYFALRPLRLAASHARELLPRRRPASPRD